MVTARQKRNWGPIQFERVVEGEIVESGKTIDSISENDIPHKGPVFKSDELPDEDTIETIKIPEKSHEWREKFEKKEPEDPPPRIKKDRVIEPELIEDSEEPPEPIEDEKDFKPTKRQVRAKLRFHKYCPPMVVLKLDPREPVQLLHNGMEVSEYIGQIQDIEFSTWVAQPGFWAWFVTEDDVDVDIYEAKKRATDYLLDVMKLDDTNPDTGLPDTRIIGLKLRVAESILNKSKSVRVENKSVNIFPQVSKKLLKQDTVTLEQRLAQLKESSGD